MKKLTLALIAVFALSSTAFAAESAVATKTVVKAPAKHSKSHSKKAKKASKASPKAPAAPVAAKTKA